MVDGKGVVVVHEEASGVQLIVKLRRSGGDKGLVELDRRCMVCGFRGKASGWGDLERMMMLCRQRC